MRPGALRQRRRAVAPRHPTIVLAVGDVPPAAAGLRFRSRRFVALNLLVCGGGSAPLAIPQWRRFLIAFP